HHTALRAETLRCLPHEFRILYRRGVDGDLVGTSIEHLPNVIEGSNPSPDGKRNKHLSGNGFYRLNGCRPTITAGGNIKEGDFVSALIAITLGNFPRVSGITNVHEPHTLHHATVLTVQ